MVFLNKSKYFLLLKRKLRGKFFALFSFLSIRNSKNDVIAEKVATFLNSEINKSSNVINLISFKEENDYFPLLKSNDFLEESFYKGLKKEILYLMDDKKLLKEDEKNNNKDRENLLIDIKNGFDNLLELKRRKSYIYYLYEYLDSFEFRTYIYKKFNKYLLDYGFKACPLSAFFKSTLYFQYCEANKGYENTIHIDRRSRVVHGLMYFGCEDFKGGEFSIYKHRKLKNQEYNITPKEEDILEFKNFEPLDNKAILILSTPNSYHKGKCSYGLRRFLYWGYTLEKVCWINS